MFTLYQKEVVQKYYIEEQVLQTHCVCVVKEKFDNAEGMTKVVMIILPSLYSIPTLVQCMQIFELIDFQYFFDSRPCEVDALRVHEIMSTLQEDETFYLTRSKDGEKLEVNINSQQAL